MKNSVLIMSEQYQSTIQTADQPIHQTVTAWLVKELNK